MRLARWIPCLIAASAAGCSSSNLTSPPAGLPVTLSALAGPVSPSISSSGNVVTAVISNYQGVCGAPPTADAGLRGNNLVMTLTSVTKHVPCTLLLGIRNYSISVSRVPAAVRTAKVVMRIVDGGNESDTVLIASPIRLP